MVHKLKNKYYTFILNENIDTEFTVEAKNKKEAYQKLWKKHSLRKDDVILDEIAW
jgi:hypothetical protein